MTTYRLAPARAGPTNPTGPVELDSEQRRVVEHPGGPLLVLAGPGTGKTTTLVEAVVDRVERRGASPDSVLALTFSRKAAEQLRDRVSARLGRTTTTTLSSTFHSFAYGLLRQHAPSPAYGGYAEPLRLLSAPEQDVVLRELLTREPESVRWPAGVAQALGTRGFVQEVQAVLARAQETGLDPAGLEALGRAHDRPDLVAAGAFMRQYLEVTGHLGALDYPGLMAQAVDLVEDPDRPEVLAGLRRRFRHVFVDEYQDTDPSQVRLLRALAGDGRDLTVVGDPDQSIYGFRGAEVRGILDFPDRFRTAEGDQAPVVALRRTRRFGGRMLAASRAIASSIGAGGAIDAETFRAFRNPRPVAPGQGEGRVTVATFDTARAETEHVADRLRRAHLEDRVPWSQMAVLVRSGRGSIPALRRSLVAAGVPVEVAADDTPLVAEPALLPLLDALRAVLSENLALDRVEALLSSPLVGLDATDVRDVARVLRRRDPHARPSPELLREAVAHPEMLDGVPGRAAAGLARLGRLLAAARARVAAGGTAEDVLWELWAGTDWPRRLRRAVDAGGASARMAHRDLDAVCALFEAAARTEERRGHTGVVGFLDALTAQQIPGDTLAERGVRGDAVRLLTAHRAKGLEWRRVVVAHVQEEQWPDLRRRTSLLQADRIGPDGLLPPTSTSTLLAEERRLFYVACTRAREELLVTAVDSPEDDGEQPSRFLTELARTDRDGASPVRREHVQGRPTRPLSLGGLVADLRRSVADPDTSPQLRRAAATRLAGLARETSAAGAALVPSADPAQWWGTRARTVSPRPVRPPDEPVRLSASTLEAIGTCPARWFLQREAGGESRPSQSQGFGSLVHALADRVARDELGTDPDQDPEAGLAELMAHLDSVWDRIDFRTPWSASRERAEAEAALRRFLDWHSRPGARTVVGTEERLDAEVALPDGGRVRLHGYADRLELDEDGRVIVVDLKTTKYPPADQDLPANPQLGLYQHAVDHGAADHLAGPGTRSGGAELVQLRKENRGRAKVQHQRPQPRDEHGTTEVERQLTEAAAMIRGESFEARPGDHCRHCSFQAICPVQGAGTVLS